MSHIIEQIPDYPAILIKWNANFSIAEEWNNTIDEIVQLLDQAPEAMFTITDATEYRISVNDLLEGTNALLKSRALISHPNLKGFITVTSSPLIKLSVDGLRSLGVSKTHYVVADLEEAYTLFNSGTL